MPKILFLNRLFGTDTEVTGCLLAELTEDLASSYDITVICGPATTSPFRIWPLIRRETYGRVKVVRTIGVKTSKDRPLLRYLNWLIYFAITWIAVSRERADVIIAETDPPTLGLTGAVFGFLQRCRFVYYCQDIYPEVAEATGCLKNRALLAVLRRCNEFAFRRADAIVALAADMAGLLRRKGIAPDKIVTIPNWIDCNKVKPHAPLARRRETDSATFVVMYAGNLGWTQNLESVLESARLLRGEPRVKFVLVGDGARKKHLQDEARRCGLANVEFGDRVSPTAMSEVLAVGDLHLIPLGAGVAGCMVPSKVYGILAAGRPFVAMMEKHAEVARLATESEVGFVVPPGDSPALARTIAQSMGNQSLLEEMGRRARLLAEQTYDRHLITARFGRFIETLLAGKPITSTWDETAMVGAEKAGVPATILAD
jgi:colanic acid biosynthesis glycosyl transferase WcaI